MKTEIKRQLVHLFFGLAFIALLVFSGLENTKLVLGTGLVLGGLTAFILSKGHRLFPFSQIVEIVGRDTEEFPGKGALSFFAGMLLTMVLFNSEQIVLGAMLVTVVGDAFSTLIGKKFGKKKIIENKSLEGSAAFFFSAEFALLLAGFSPATSLVVALSGTIVELIPFEDNLTIPVACGAVLTFLI